MLLIDWYKRYLLWTNRIQWNINKQILFFIINIEHFSANVVHFPVAPKCLTLVRLIKFEIMAKYQVTEEWTNYRIWEIEADSEHQATELVMNGHGEQVSDQIDWHYQQTNRQTDRQPARRQNDA